MLNPLQVILSLLIIAAGFQLADNRSPAVHTNTTDLQHNSQDAVVEGAKHGEACIADYLLIPGGHCKVRNFN